jgi:hypothetical protein
MGCEILDKSKWGNTQENQSLTDNDSQESKVAITEQSISYNSPIINCMPPELSRHIQKLDSIVQTGIDTLSITNLSVLASLSGGAKIFDRKDDSTGTPIIIYSAGLFKSGGGKTVSANKNKEYFLDWKEDEHARIQNEMDTRKKQIEVELKNLGNSTSDRALKSKLTEELLTMQTQPDVYLEGASAEGFTSSIACKSTPFLFIDNFGKYIISSGKNELNAEMLRMLDNVFDSGKITTRRIKGDNKRAQQLSIDGFGAYFSSTIGEGNLKPKDIKSNIENGFLNKVLVIFQDTVEKPIPLQSSLNSDDKESIEKFARRYYAMSKENHFYLNDEAYTVYAEYHKRTSDEYIRRYNNDEHLAGHIIRLLKIAKRIACIFEIASKCESYEKKDLITEKANDEDRYMLPVCMKSMQMAIDFIYYIKSEHTSKIMMYAESKNGKLNKPDVVLTKIISLSKDKKVIDHRSIIGRLSKAQRMTVNELMPIMQKLLNEGKIGQYDDGTYFLIRTK